MDEFDKEKQKALKWIKENSFYLNDDEKRDIKNWTHQEKGKCQNCGVSFIFDDRALSSYHFFNPNCDNCQGVFCEKCMFGENEYSIYPWCQTCYDDVVKEKFRESQYINRK